MTYVKFRKLVPVSALSFQTPQPAVIQRTPLIGLDTSSALRNNVSGFSSKTLTMRPIYL